MIDRIAISPTGRSPLPPPTAVAKPTLLFVDDEERILRSLRMLFAANFRVLVTTDGHEALEILKREKVHAIISDQRMPLMAGVELLRQARDIAPDTMRLLLTGYSDIESIIGSINDGEVFRYINKPWNADEIRAIVSEAANIALSLEQVLAKPLPQSSADIRGILLIDDSAEIANSLKQYIEESFPGAFRLEWANNLNDAMALLETRKLSVIISDVTVGNVDMTAFIKTLKQIHPQMVTIVLTTFRDTSLLVELINQGQVHRFLPKPMRKTMVLRGIQSGMILADEIRRRPEAIKRHKVDTPKNIPDTGIINRIRGLFRNVGKA